MKIQYSRKSDLFEIGETGAPLHRKRIVFLTNIEKSQLEETEFDGYLNRCMMKNNK